ncbi:MAG: DUF4150 domain-containing protein [Gammaproteobacteria bacterium]|nr:DUF4150 domain-containing protein [Gammaproteobacteria bacterium]
MFVNCSAGGQSMAMPDVCKVPVPSPAGPIPTPMPFPNIALGNTAVPNQTKLMIMGMPAHNLMTMIPMTSGDEAGLLGGLVSQMIKGPCKHLKGSTKMMIMGIPATRMLDQTGQNGAAPNAMGTTIAPAQSKLMVMA